MQRLWTQPAAAAPDPPAELSVPRTAVASAVPPPAGGWKDGLVVVVVLCSVHLHCKHNSVRGRGGTNTHTHKLSLLWLDAAVPCLVYRGVRAVPRSMPMQMETTVAATAAAAAAGGACSVLCVLCGY